MAGSSMPSVTSSPIAAATHVAQVLHPETYELVASRRLALRSRSRRSPIARHTLLDLDEGLRWSLLDVRRTGGRVCRSSLLRFTGIVFARVRAGDGWPCSPATWWSASSRSDACSDSCQGSALLR